MKTQFAHPSSHRTNLSSLMRIAAFVVIAALIGIALFSSSSALSSNQALRNNQALLALHLTSPVQETIETFAGDCTTPKSTFFLGETVCAKTDSVDLNFPGGRWVHWIRQDNSIAHGGSGTTDITMNPQTFTFIPDTLGLWKVTIAETGDDSQTPAVFTVIGNPPIATYDGATCTILQDNFNVGDTVCAKANSNFTGTRFIHFVDSEGGVIQTNTITPTSPSANYVTTTAGNFRVYLTDGDGLLARAFFTVSDPENPKVDLSVLKYNKTGEMTFGNAVSYAILVTNNGPDSASTVALTDAVPSGLTYVSSSQDSGPTFTQTQTDPVTTWEIASLPAGATATFTVTYTVNAAAGTTISNTASITNNTEETHNEDNTSITFDVVASGGGAPECSLDCPNNIVTTATVHGQGGGATVTFSAPEAVGSCGTVTTDPASGSFFPTGTTTVTATSSTGNGFCSFTVTVIDSPAPTISCPSNLSATANPGQPSAFVPDPNGSQSNVGTASATGTNVVVTGSRDDGEALTAAYPIGVTKITWIATEYDRDPQDPEALPTGRSASCQQTITVFPNQTLTITCQSNKTAASPNGCDPATVDPGQATSNSSTATITAQRSDGQALNDPYPVGTTTIEWTATDTDTQSASCTQTITVTGNVTQPPTLSVPPNVTASTNSCGQIVGESQLGTATASDDCGPVNVARSGVPPGNFFPTGTTTITYTATNSVGTTTGTQTVTVTEDPAVNPTITAPNDVTLFTGAGATSCGVTVSNLDATLGTATASDNCPGVVVTRIGVPAGNVFPVGNTTVTYRATDRSGNFADDTQVVTVVDNTPPVVTAPGPVTLHTGPGATSCSVTVNDLDGTFGTGSATDNCPGVGAVSRSGVPAGNVFPVGQTTLTYSATDAHGNTGTATQLVTVVDNTAPVISCPANIVLEPTCPSGAIATFADATATDNCGVQSVARTAGPASGSVFPIGTTTVTFTATDIHGNTASCSFTVTVKTVVQTIDDLKAAVNANQQLSGPQKNGLISKLDAARQHVLSGNQNGACAKLADFVNSVQTFIDHGDISAATGNAWIHTANNLRNTIGCTSLPCS